MLKFKIILAFALLRLIAFSQLATKVIELEDGSTGYSITYKKKPIDNYIYTEAYLENGFMFVSQDVNGVPKYGAYAPDSRLIIEPKYEPLELLFVHEKPTFFLIYLMSESGEPNFGLFDLTGKMVLEPTYKEIIVIEDYFEGKPMAYLQLAKINEEGEIQKGIANAQGKVIIEPKYAEVEWTSLEGFENKYYFLASETDKKYLYNLQGKLILGEGYDNMGGFCGGRKLIALRRKWLNEDGEDRFTYGFYDLIAEKQVFSCIFDGWKAAGNDEIIVEKGDKQGLINASGYILEPNIDRIQLFSDSGLYICQSNGAEDFQVFISRSKKMLDVKCTDAYENWPLLIMQLPVANEGDVSDIVLYNLETNQLLNERYQSYEMREFSNTTVSKNSKWYQMREDGLLGPEIPGVWNQCVFVSEKVLKVEMNQLYGLIKSDGKVILAPTYEDMSGWNKEGICVKLAGKYGLIDYDGSLIIPCQYTNAFNFYNGKAEVTEDSGTYFINRKNERVD